MDAFKTEDHRRHGIQAEKPVEPWERPGYFRLDCVPDRGPVLQWLATLSMIAGVVSVFFFVAGIYEALVHRVTRVSVLAGPALVLLVVTVVGLLLGLPAWVLSRRDLAAMKVGRVDPGGEPATVEARRFAFVGLVQSGLTAPVYATIVFLVLIRA